MFTSFNPTFTDLIDDFEIFLRYLGGKANLTLTGAGDLKAADLWALNERVSYKAPAYVTPRSRQLDYPLLGFLFQIATVSRLYTVSVGKVNTLLPNADRLDAYQGLTTEEKYVFLLETAAAAVRLVLRRLGHARWRRPQRAGSRVVSVWYRQTA